MKIEITKTEKGFTAKIPFSLKDSFKKAIPSAKWNKDEKVWEIGPRSGKKAQAWAEQAQQVENVAEQAEEVQATEQEYQQAIAELARIKAELEKSIEESKSINEILADIASVKTEIAKTKAKLEQKNEEIARKNSEIKQVLSDIIDMKAIAEAQSVMARLQGKMTTVNRIEFEKAQDTINEQRHKLAEVGLGSCGLDDLWRINWNRPDRDKISNCRSLLEVYICNSRS